MTTSSRPRRVLAAWVAPLCFMLLLLTAGLGMATTTITTTGKVTPTGTPSVSTPSPTVTQSMPAGTQDQGKKENKDSGEWTWRLWSMLGVITVCGAIGGIADGLRTNLRYRLSLPALHRVRYRVGDASATPSKPGQGTPPAKPAAEAGETVVSETVTFTARELELGFLGDAIVGVVAAFSVFVVSSAVFPGAAEQNVTQMNLVHLIGWALVAGYLGPRLMRMITTKIGSLDEVKETANQASTDAIAAKAAAESGKQSADAAKATIKAVEESHPLVVEAQRLLTVNEVADLLAEKIAPADRKSNYLDKAEEKYKLALALHPDSASQLIGLANVYYDMAELGAPATEKDPRTVPDLWKAGVETLEKALKADPASAKARYNLACFKAKANAASGSDTYPKAGIFEDLKTAYKASPDFQSFAFTDPDFDALRQGRSELKPEDLALIDKDTPKR